MNVILSDIKIVDLIIGASNNVGSLVSTPYVETLSAFVARRESFRKKWISVFKDQIVVDLGAGKTCQGYELACVGGAKAYIAVEPLNHWFIKNNIF